MDLDPAPDLNLESPDGALPGIPIVPRGTRAREAAQEAAPAAPAAPGVCVPCLVARGMILLVGVALLVFLVVRERRKLAGAESQPPERHGE